MLSGTEVQESSGIVVQAIPERQQITKQMLIRMARGLIQHEVFGRDLVSRQLPPFGARAAASRSHGENTRQPTPHTTATRTE